MLEGLLAIAAAVGAFLFLKHHKTIVGAGAPGTIVDVSPLLGETSVVLSPGQTLRINLPKEWILMSPVGANPAEQPLQPVPDRGIGGVTFTAAQPGRQSLMFSLTTAADLDKFHRTGIGHSRSVTVNVDIEGGTAAAGYYARPYRDFWRGLAHDPYWRAREDRWRRFRYWEPSWGAHPPAQADVTDVAE